MEFPKSSIQTRVLNLPAMILQKHCVMQEYGFQWMAEAVGSDPDKFAISRQEERARMAVRITATIVEEPETDSLIEDDDGVQAHFVASAGREGQQNLFL